jgi:2-dehydro-3-deoxyphosphogluconate aldolase/(4S)-4-hydroxy-2-oxoglutarate aldolase
VEVVLRTPAAAEALGLIAEQVPELMLGAGTVLSVEQVSRSPLSTEPAAQEIKIL